MSSTSRIREDVARSQSTFRHLVNALARPGIVVPIGEPGLYDSRHDSSIDTPLSSSTQSLVDTLLDVETTFAVTSSKTEGHARLIRERTYARIAAPEEADFLFLLRGGSSAEQFMESARIGTLEEPHRGATVVIEVDELAPVEKPGTLRHDLVGPGIAGLRSLWIAADFDWCAPRNRKVVTYPLGLEVFLVDATNNLVGLPRTTRIQPASDTGAI